MTDDAEERALHEALDRAEAENAHLRAALLLACRDGWSDSQAAMEHYLTTASDWETDHDR